jgi:vacuolar-type H+-ATPase subunit F/Vma7
MTFFCIADKDSALGFRFAGIETREIASRSEAREALKVAMAVEDVGVIIVTEKVSSYLREEVDELMYEHDLPLIMEVPSRGMKRSRRTATEFVKRAIGISI